MITDLFFSAGFTPQEIGRYMDPDKEVPVPIFGGRSFRHMAQTLGTDWGRNLIDKDLWVNLVIAAKNRPNLVVIDDVRFPNEFEAIKAEGGQVWRIYRPGQEPVNDHPSEGLLEGREFDEQIANDGSVGELEAKVIAALTGPF